jgi:hypothetical protein
VASIAKPTTTVLQTADKLKFVQRLEAVGQNAMCLLDALRDNLVRALVSSPHSPFSHSIQ